jgi:hypothetical protein
MKANVRQATLPVVCLAWIVSLMIGGAWAASASTAKTAAAPSANQAIGRDEIWPLTLKAGETSITLYQPQIDSWDGYKLEARLAARADGESDQTLAAEYAITSNRLREVPAGACGPRDPAGLVRHGSPPDGIEIARKIPVIIEFLISVWIDTPKDPPKGGCYRTISDLRRRRIVASPAYLLRLGSFKNSAGVRVLTALPKWLPQHLERLQVIL